MADDQKPKTMDINDLVRELSKSSTTPVAPTPPLAPPTQAPRPPSFPAKPFVPTPSTLPSINPPPLKPSIPPAIPSVPPLIKSSLPKQPETMPRPQVNAPLPPLNKPSQPTIGQIKPMSPSVPVVPTPPTSGVKEYQSSIRTMNEDISKLKQGQKPMGVEIPRKVEQIPVAKPVVPQPVIPNQQFKVPSVNLGEAQKTGPLTQSKDVKQQITPKMEPKQQIYVPPESGQKRINRNMLFVGIGVAAAIVVGFSYWFFVLRSPSPEIVIESPTPTPTVSKTSIPTPTPTLTSIFSGVPKQNTSIVLNNILASFVSDISVMVVAPGSFKIIEAVDAQTPSVLYNFSELLSKLAFNIPNELVNNFGNDSAMFIYGQKESFDLSSNLKVEVTAPNRIVIVAEIKDPSGVSAVTNIWETSLSSDLNPLFALGKANKDQPGFLDNSYRGVGIRYKNFPYPDNTIDYSIVIASNGKSYLVMADSREAMYATIDKLKGF